MKKTKKKQHRRASQRSASAPRLPVVSRLELSEIRLLELQSSIRIASAKLPTKQAIRAGCQWGINEDTQRVLANIEVVVESVSEDEAGSKLLIRLVQQAVFTSTDLPDPRTCTQDEIHAVNSLGMFVCWPYIRETIQALTAKMGIPPLVLPVIRPSFAAGAISVDVPQAKGK